MPRGDGTGPAGLGPMTGRATGYCAGYEQPGHMNPIPGRGFWCRGGRAGGRGWRHWYYATGLTGWQRAPMGRFCPYGEPYAAPYGFSPMTSCAPLFVRGSHGIHLGKRQVLGSLLL